MGFYLLPEAPPDRDQAAPLGEDRSHPGEVKLWHPPADRWRRHRSGRGRSTCGRNSARGVEMSGYGDWEHAEYEALMTRGRDAERAALICWTAAGLAAAVLLSWGIGFAVHSIAETARLRQANPGAFWHQVRQGPMETPPERLTMTR